MNTQMLEIPFYYNMIEPVTGMDLTTFLVMPIISELYWTYGNRNLSLLIKPTTGTQLDWSNAHNATQAKVAVTLGWYIHETNGTIVEAFESDIEVDVSLALQAQRNKSIDLSFA